MHEPSHYVDSLSYEEEEACMNRVYVDSLSYEEEDTCMSKLT
jgi:hypothetical protein